MSARGTAFQSRFLEYSYVSAHDIRQELLAAPSRFVPRAWLVGTAWAIILLLATGLRFHHLDASYWIDEINTHDRAAAGLAHAWSDETPLAYVASLASMSILGDTEAVLRLPSCLAGIACVLTLMWVAARAAGPLAGLLAGFLLATASYHIYWSQLARYYTFTTLFGLGLIWYLNRAITTGRWHYWLLAAVCTTLGALAHLTFLPIAGAVFLGAGLYLIRSPRAHWIALTALVLCFSSGMALPASKNLEKVQLLVASGDSVGAPAVSTGEAPGSKPTYRLTWNKYRFFLRQYFPALSGDTRLRYAGILTGLAGLIVLWRRVPPLAAMVSSGILLIPAPFMLVDVHHAHYARYYCFLIPLWQLAMAAGVAWGVEVLGRLRLRRGLDGRRILDRESPPGRSRAAVRAVLHVTTLVLVVWGLQTGLRESLEAYYDRTPARDWRGMAREMAPYLRPDDLILYGNYQEVLLERVKFELGFYLDRYSANGASRGVAWQWCKEPSDAAAALRAHPFRTVWLVGDDTWPDLLAPDFFEQLGTNPKDAGQRFGIATLWTFGRPAANLCEAAAGAMTLGAGDDSTESFAVDIVPNVYPIRNAGFEIQDGELPLGWQAEPDSMPFVARSIDGQEHGHALKLLPRPGGATLWQPLVPGPSPGMTIRVEAAVRSSEESPVRLGLAWRTADRQPAVLQQFNASSSWENVAATIEVPLDAEFGSIRVLLQGVSPGTAYFDNLSVEAVSPLLDPGQDYILSFKVKHTNHDRYPYALSVEGETRNGESFSRTLLRPPLLSKDWHQAAFRLRPGVELPAQVQSLTIRVESESSGGPRVWANHWQFESGEFPSPFVPGIRPPHDELLAERPPK